MKRSITLLAALIIATAASAQERDAGALLALFGLKLHQPLALPQCARKNFGMGADVYRPPTSGPCYKHEVHGPLLPNDTVFIKWPNETQPKIVRGELVVAQVIDGTVEALWVTTGGIATEESDLALLRQKLGEPVKVTREPGQSDSGGRIDAISAMWRLGDDGGYVTLLGVGVDERNRMHPESGLMIVRSAKAVAADTRSMREGAPLSHKKAPPARG
jgi:hypothetical protein